MTPFTPAERRLTDLLHLLAIVLGILGIAYAFAFAEAGAGLGLLAFAAWFASGDVRRFRWLAWTVCSGLGFLTLIYVILAIEMYPPAAITADTPLNMRTLLLGAAVLSGVSALALLVFILQTSPSHDTVLPWKTAKPTTRTERIARYVLAGFAFLAALGGALTIYAPSTAPFALRPLFASLEYVAPAALLFYLLMVLAGIAALQYRQHSECLTLIITGLMLTVLGYLPGTGHAAYYFLALIPAELRGEADALVAAPHRGVMLFVLVYAALLGVMWFLRARLHHTLLNYLHFFKPGQFWALAAISDGLIEGGDRELLKPHEIALRVDNHLASFPAPKLALSRLAIAALDGLIPFIFGARPPLSLMHLEQRSAFLNRHFKVDIIERRGWYALFDYFKLEQPTQLIEGAMRFVMQFAYLGYYGEPKVQEAIGYVPFSQRAKTRSIPLKPIRRYEPLQVFKPDDADRLGLDVVDDVDVVIIGSGAAGAILAENLLSKGRRVLMLEKGRYVDPDSFSEDEIDMIGRLYGDNALQVTAALNFTILQGSAVGGTTVANNAVCFETPPQVLERWNREFDAGIHELDYWAAQTAVMKRLSVEPVDRTAKALSAASIVNPLAHRLHTGIDKVLAERGYVFEPVKANIVDCLGCGYCNMGCKYGRKLSMLDEVLPAAQKTYGDRLQIWAEAEATKLYESSGRITGIDVRLGARRTIHIRNPKTVVVSGGAVASSWLLQRSGIGRNLPIGRRLAFNMGSPLHARFGEVVNAYDGLQISHYLQIPNENDFIYETWFNPPVAQALAMAGWLDSHFKNMSRYNHFVAMGVVVGTEINEASHIRKAAAFPGAPEVFFEPTARDREKLVDAMITMGKVLLASGAEEVYASTRRYHSYTAYQPGDRVTRPQASYRDEGELMQYLRQLVAKDGDLMLSSAHPQGGNALGTVLDKDFRVRGYDNLYVCDASVFPTSITVNPQLTVMNLAQYASSRIM